MGRGLRIKFYDEEVYYHVMSRVAGGEYLLRRRDVKEKFLEILFRLLKGFGFKLKAYVVMDNHFHLIVQSFKISDLTDREVFDRAKSAGIYSRLVNLRDIFTLRRRLGDISEFMKLLKEKFSRWFNRRHKRIGYFWGGRFKSVVLEDGMAYEVCKRYIELNPVRAKIVRDENKYEFSSCSYRDKGYEEFRFKRFTAFCNGKILGSRGFIEKIHDKLKKKFKLKGRKNYKGIDKKLPFFSFSHFKEM